MEWSVLELEDTLKSQICFAHLITQVNILLVSRAFGGFSVSVGDVLPL